MLLRRFHYICSLLLTYYSTKYSDRICNLSSWNEINGGWINRYSTCKCCFALRIGSLNRIIYRIDLIETNNLTIKFAKKSSSWCYFNKIKHAHVDANILMFYTITRCYSFSILALAIHLNGENKFDERSATNACTHV